MIGLIHWNLFHHYFKTLDTCYKYCLRETISRELIKQPSNFSLKLFCRKDNALIVEVVGDSNRIDDDYPNALHKREEFYDRLYALTVQEDKAYSSKWLYIVSKTYLGNRPGPLTLTYQKYKLKTEPTIMSQASICK